MKTAIACFAIALGAAIPLQGAAAWDNSQKASLTAASQSHDLSAAKKKKRSTVSVFPAHFGYYPQAFSPGDPSWQSPELIRRRALGQCVIDLGYGRYEACD